MASKKTLTLLMVTSILIPGVIGLPFSLPNFGDDNQEHELPKGMEQELAERSNNTYQSMVESLPEDYQERKNMTAEYGEEVCGMPEVEKIEEDLENSGEAQATVRQLQNALSITNNYLETGIKSSDLDSVYGNSKKVAKYASAIGSYNTWREKGCDVSEAPTNKSMDEFYKATGILTFEIMLIQTAPSYKLASKSTRIFNRQAGVAKIRKYCGDECYSAALSLPHWGVRLSSDGFLDYTLETANNENIQINRNSLKTATEGVADTLPKEPASRRIEDARKNAEKFVGDFDEKSSNMSSEEINEGGKSIIQTVKSLIF